MKFSFIGTFQSWYLCSFTSSFTWNFQNLIFSNIFEAVKKKQAKYEINQNFYENLYFLTPKLGFFGKFQEVHLCHFLSSFT